MFHTRHFHYQLFHVNKFINGKGLLSNWHKLSTTTIYGRQFSKIPDRNGRSCIIQSKHQEFCQCKHFCNGNDDIHIFPEESANSVTIPSPEIPTNNTIQQQQHLERTEKFVENHAHLETRWLELGNKEQIELKLQKGKSGQKFFDLSLKTINGQYIRFRKILVPQDAYAFIRALDELIVELAADNFEQKLNIQESTDQQHRSKFKLRNVEFTGLFHKFQLELMLFINNKRGMLQKEICLGLYAMNKNTAKERWLNLPLCALPWLRKQMAEMLEKHDGTEKIEKEAPAQIPKQFFHMHVFRAPPFLRNGIPSGHSLGQKGRQPQFCNKKPTSQSQMAELDEGLRALFDFDNEDMKKYSTMMAKVKNPSRQ